MGSQARSFVMMLPHTWLQLPEQVRPTCQMGPGRLGRECCLRSHAVSSRQGCIRPRIPDSSFIQQIFPTCQALGVQDGEDEVCSVSQGDRR